MSCQFTFVILILTHHNCSLFLIYRSEHLYGFPSLVFDGGTAITYTASDRNGYILGGGISPGLLQRLNSMHESTDALPKISMEDIGDMIEKAVKQTKPLKIFSSNTQDAMCVSVLSELASNAREVIKLWLEKVDNGRKNNNKQKQNKERKVLVTGKTIIKILMISLNVLLVTHQCMISIFLR